MKVKISMFLILVFALFVFSATIISLSLTNKESPKNFVDNITVVAKSDIFYDYKITKYPSNVQIVDLGVENTGNKIGIAIEPWMFDFGLIPIGENSVEKSIIFEVSEGDEAKVEIKVFGNISEMISFSKNNFYPKGDDNVSIFLNITKNTKPGNYTGEIDVIIQKEKL